MSNVSNNSFSRELYSFGMNVEKTARQAFKEVLKPINKLVNPEFEKLQSDISRYDNFNAYLNHMHKDSGAKSINYQA